MKRLTYCVENQWRYAKAGGSVWLLHLAGATSPYYASVHLSLLGFGLGLTLWKRVALDWEPIEHDGYAGEPQGMEKAP